MLFKMTDMISYITAVVELHCFVFFPFPCVHQFFFLFIKNSNSHLDSASNVVKCCKVLYDSDNKLHLDIKQHQEMAK